MWRHDIVTDDLPEDTFDLVHARLVLAHLPAPQTALHRMAGPLPSSGMAYHTPVAATILIAKHQDIATAILTALDMSCYNECMRERNRPAGRLPGDALGPR